MPVLLEHPADEQVVHREPARDRDAPPAQVADGLAPASRSATMMTAPDRWPSDTILAATPLSTRSITIGASRYAAFTLPAMNDSFSSGQPLYLLYSAEESARVTSTTDRPSASRDIATLAIGSVRFHVTGSPPTSRERTADPGTSEPRPLIVTWRAVTRTAHAATAPSATPRLGERGVTAPQFTRFCKSTQDDALGQLPDLPPSRRRHAIATQPMTCPPNAFRSSTGVVRLDPAGSGSGGWGTTPADPRAKAARAASTKWEDADTTKIP